jgi:hypothetical protein
MSCFSRVGWSIRGAGRRRFWAWLIASRSIEKFDVGSKHPAAMLATIQPERTIGVADLDLRSCLSLVSGRLSHTTCVTVVL